MKVGDLLKKATKLKKENKVEEAIQVLDEAYKKGTYEPPSHQMEEDEEYTDFDKLLTLQDLVRKAKYLQEISKRLRFADLMIKSLSLNDAEGKVAVVLNQYAFDYGKIKNGVVEIDKAPTQQDIAKMAGTSRETVNRVLGTFSKKGMIEIEGSIIRIMNYEEFTQLYL